MKKRILSLIMSVSLVIGTISVSAVSINFEDINDVNNENLSNEEFDSEIIEIQNDEIYVDNSLEIDAISSEATDYGIMTTAVEDGTLEYVKTVSGYGYTATTQRSSSNHYWSISTGSDADLNNTLLKGNGSSGYKNFGATSSSKVPLFDYVYLPRGSVLKFELYGTSCGHVGSNAQVYLSNGIDSTYIGALTVPKTDENLPTKSVVLNYTLHKSGNYKAEGIGVSYNCTSSSGHGIFIKSTYDIYRYKYSISYNLNSGSLSKTNPTYYYEEDEDIVLNNPTKTGYTFLGWTGSNGSITSTNVVIPGGSTGNKTYTANWKINQYPVTYIDLAPDNEELGRTTRYVNWNSSVRGSDLGSNTVENVYYNGYYYVSDTTATVTTEGAIVYRKFEATNIDKTVSLTWNDNDDEDGVRPDKYTLKLKQNGKVINEVELPSSQTNYTFTDLPKYDSNGNKYEYSFDASASDRYEIRFDDNGNLIIEDYLPANFSVIIPKQIVLDGNTGEASYTVSVNGTFYYNDTLTVIPEKSLTLSDRSNISTMKANVSLTQTHFSKEDISSVVNGIISTDKKLFAGKWNGSFNFDIKFVMQN